MKESANLDLLRATAVLLVLCAHLFAVFGHEQVGPLYAKNAGWLGVMLFFVHTSFVLMFSLARQTRKYPEHPWRDFMIRRIFRIYPLSIACILFILAFRIPSTNLSAFHMEYLGARSFGELAANLLLAQNLTGANSILGPLWSLPLEIQMYLFLPFLFVFANRTKSPWPLFVLWIAACSLGIAQIYVQHAWRLSLLLFVPCFLPGIIAYKLSMARIRQLPFSGWAMTLFFLIAAFLCTPEAKKHMYFSWIACLAVGCAVPFFREVKSRYIRASCHTIAKYSYGIYLGHFLCIRLAFITLHQAHLFLQWWVFSVSLIGASWFMYSFIEEPMISVGARLVGRLNVLPKEIASSSTAATGGS
jgi:peptidoglycan/LPS O-acetylase OafA/YrhL